MYWCIELANELGQTCEKVTDGTIDATLRETDEFEEILAEAVYEGLTWVSSILAAAFDEYIQGATAIEIGMRKARLNVRDCRNLEKSLERVLGFGAKVVEFKILQVLNTKLGVSEEITLDFKFSDEVDKARKLYGSKP